MKMITIKMNEKQEQKKEEKVILALECLAIIVIRAVYILFSLYFLFQIEFEPAVMSFVTCFVGSCIICAIPVRKLIK